MSLYGIEKIEGQYEDFLQDESKKTGTACSISFPKNAQEIRETLEYLAKDGISITIQGARTGITAGAVPYGGHILNLGRMDNVTGMEFDSANNRYLLKVQSGLILSRLQNMLENREFDTRDWSADSIAAYEAFKESEVFFFPPDPTETSASIGGMAACNSSGARSFFYGSVRRYIQSMDIVLADGSGLSVARSRDKVTDGNFSIQADDGRVLAGQIPEYLMPNVKNASGYYSSKEMDLIDLFIGSEGTIGIIAGITLVLLPKPAVIWGVTVFFDTEAQALEYVREVREESSGASPAALEFFNSDTLNLLRKSRVINAAFSEMPEIPGAGNTAVYVEFHGKSEEEVYVAVMAATELIGKCGGNEDNTWLASNKVELEKLHVFRHAAPESVNQIIGERKKKYPELTKLGTDMAVPDESLFEVMDMYNTDLCKAQLESVIFGHIGNNHVHVNILPRTMEEYEIGLKLYHKWASKVIGLGGTISAEHGIGKLKTSLLKQMYGDVGIRQMLMVKQTFDPESRLNRGNLF